jgi:hypothetical protein
MKTPHPDLANQWRIWSCGKGIYHNELNSLALARSGDTILTESLLK